MYIYKVYDINRKVVLKFKSGYMSCFEILWILQDNKDYISCTRSKIKTYYNQVSFF